MKTLSKLAQIAVLAIASLSAYAAPLAWQDSLEPLPPSEWNRDRAAHLLERAGFGGTPAELAQLAAMSPQQAVRSLVYYAHALAAWNKENHFRAMAATEDGEAATR